MIINQCNIYTLLWCYYFWHSNSFATSDIYSRALLLFSIAMSLYYALIVNIQYKVPCYFKGVNVLFIMFSVYGIARYSEGSVLLLDGTTIDGYYSLKKIYISILPTYAYYHFSKQGLLNEKVLKVYSALFLILCFLAYNSYYSKHFGIDYDDSIERTNNTGYFFLAMLPIITIWKDRPILQYFLLSIVIVMLFFCFKRGAIFSGCLCTIVFLYLSLKNSSKRRKFLLLFLTSVLLVVAYYLVSYLFENSYYFNLRYERTIEGDANGRDIIYPLFWNYLKNLTSSKLLFFGGGFDYSIKNFGIYCHNDWFEMAINHGILGVVCYIYYWHCFIKNIRCKKENKAIFSAMIIFFIFSFFNTFYSFSINSLIIFSTSMFGYCLASKDNSVKVITKKMSYEKSNIFNSN